MKIKLIKKFNTGFHGKNNKKKFSGEFSQIKRTNQFKRKTLKRIFMKKISETILTIYVSSKLNFQ